MPTFLLYMSKPSSADETDATLVTLDDEPTNRHMYKPSSADETGPTLVTLDDEPTTARPPSDDETSSLE